MVRRLFFFTFLVAALLTACSDNDSFSVSSGNRLSFQKDTIRFDTLFSTVPSSTRTLWIHNESSDGIRIQTARLERGTQSGFRVNIDGTYLNPVATDFEVRKGDSILVFVEVTTHENHAREPQLVEDNLLLTLESGVEQRINLRTYSWDAQKVTNLTILRDTVIESSKPIIFYGDGITIGEDATLTLRNTELYFHDGTGIFVTGRLIADNCLFRGDRLDHMFDYLPYDRIPSQWDGIIICPSSGHNELKNCEIRNAVDAIQCDSTELSLVRTAIYNCGGVGVTAHNSDVMLSYCVVANTADDCLSFEGCQAAVDHCTLAQFYPFSANRGAALSFVPSDQPMMLLCTNTLVTGYDADVVMGQPHQTEEPACDYYFADCLLRTDNIVDPDRFVNIIWETPKDTLQGKQHFETFDEDNFIYNFNIVEKSPAFSRNIGCILKEDEE